MIKTAGDSQYKCAACIDHCTSCAEATKDKCQTCEKGYGFNDDKTQCVKCIDNCDKCNVDNTKCDSSSSSTPSGTGCSSGYYRTSDEKCSKCPDHCEACESDSNHEKCDDNKCEAGYLKSEVDGKCYYKAELATSGCAKSNKAEGKENNSGHMCLECDGGLDFQDDGKLCAESSSYMTTILFALVVLVAIF